MRPSPDAGPACTDDAQEDCVFCAILDGREPGSMVYQDDTVVAFLDLFPATPGHLVVIPRAHAPGLEDLDEATGAHVWAVAQRLASALRRSGLPCEGINLLLCDGEAAFQSVSHLHLHVIPRHTGDGWTIEPDPSPRQERAGLDRQAQQIAAAMEG